MMLLGLFGGDYVNIIVWDERIVINGVGCLDGVEIKGEYIIV